MEGEDPDAFAEEAQEVHLDVACLVDLVDPYPEALPVHQNSQIAQIHHTKMSHH